jgi:hypothetical protein
MPLFMQAGGRNTSSGAYCGVVRRASSCLGFESGVRDFRREAGAWNMVIGFTTKVQLVGFVALYFE